MSGPPCDLLIAEAVAASRPYQRAIIRIGSIHEAARDLLLQRVSNLLDSRMVKTSVSSKVGFYRMRIRGRNHVL